MVEFSQHPDPMMLDLQHYLAAVNAPIPDEHLRAYAPPETSVREACRIMLKHGIRRLIVARGDLVRGVFSAQDAVRVLAAADLRIDG